MRVAFMHDWLVTYRGGEKVLECLLELFPDAPLFTMFYDPRLLPSSITQRQVVYPRGWNRLRRIRKLLFPFYPAIVESLDFHGFDLIISTSSCAAKAAIPMPGAKHLCYIHSPMRYVWDQMDAYLHPLRVVPGAQAAVRMLAPWLRVWDSSTCVRVDRFVANSRFVQQRVSRFYGREARVIHPPINLEMYQPAPRPTRDYFLVAGAFVPYKRMDLAIQACNASGHRLIVAGSGPQERQLRALAGPKTEFVISPNDNEFRLLLANARALLMPGVEDFGMISVECLAAGTPVLAFRAGGALDFVVPGETGRFFAAQDIPSLQEAMTNFSSDDFAPECLATFAQQFSRANFLQKMREEIASVTSMSS